MMMTMMSHRHTKEASRYSPTSVVVTNNAALHVGIENAPELPNLNAPTSKPSRKRVRVADDDGSYRVAIIPRLLPVVADVVQDQQQQEESSSSSSSSWLSKAELRENCLNARRDIAIAQQSDPEYLRAFSRTFQACSTKKASLSQLLQHDENVRRVAYGGGGDCCGNNPNNSNSSSSSLRGLEYKAAHKALSEYRRLHVQNVLKVQQQQQQLGNTTTTTSSSSSSITDVQEAKWELLRSVSTKTSRTSRTLARILGHMDEYHLHSLLKKELALASSSSNY